jgi:hypothetical protein
MPISTSKLAWTAFTYLYGLFSLAVTFLIVILDGSIFHRRSKKATSDLALGTSFPLVSSRIHPKSPFSIARDNFWNLASTKHGKHCFFTLDTGAKLHYVEHISPKHATPSDPSPTNLVIFLHGFPDSWALWKDYLDFPDSATRAWLVALDLPGHGGSDGLADYGANEFLECMTDFILSMRKKYLDQAGEEGKVVIVAHDWGGVVALRLAAEAPRLADRFIISNTMLVSLIIFSLTSMPSNQHVLPLSYAT